MKTNRRFLLTAIFALAITFTLSCSSDGGNEGSDNSNSVTSECDIIPDKCPDAVTGDNTVSCGGQTYRTVKIGEQVWMAENLNYNVSCSKCYNNDPANCAKYGKLYNWNTAMSVCPSGWRLSSTDDWDILIDYIDSDNGHSGCAGMYAKDTSGWNGYGGTDKYGFSALPGGNGNLDDGFHYVGERALWWSATGGGNNYAYYGEVRNFCEFVSWHGTYKPTLLSVRCLKD